MLRWLENTRRTDTRDLGWDVHCHLLPGVDDGARSLADAAEGISQIRALGFSGAVLTPHIYPEVFDNVENDLQMAFEHFLKTISAEHDGFSLTLAAEYFSTPELLERIYSRDPSLLTFGSKNPLILVEFPRNVTPNDIEELIFATNFAGYCPVLAHIERYSLIQRANFLELMAKYRHMGAWIQINLASVMGAYGASAKAACRKAVKANQVDLIGSDWHHRGSLSQAGASLKWLNKVGNQFQNTSLG